MKFYSILLIIIISTTTAVFSQTLSSTQQDAINHYIDFANETKKVATSVTGSITSYHDNLVLFRNGKSYYKLAGYKCPIMPEEYYYKRAINSTGLAESDKSSLTTIAKELWKLTDQLDKECKSLETYFTLEDYKTDKFALYDSLVNSIQHTLSLLKYSEESLNTKARKLYKKLQAPSNDNAYYKAEQLMQKSIDAEKQLLDSWTYNLNKKINTGFPVDNIRKSCTNTDQLLVQLRQRKSGMGNYSQTVLNSFIEALESFQENKRRAIDDYNFEAKKSDVHANNVYMDLINLFNGTLVADYNNFVNLSIQHGYRSIKQVEYLALYQVRNQAVQLESSVAPFKDIPRIPITVAIQPSSLSAAQHKAHNNYINFINDALRQTEHLRLLLTNFNSSAVYYKDLTTYKGKGGLTFDPSDYKIPFSSHQVLTEESVNIAGTYKKSLNDQAEVLMNILKEMEGLSIELNKQAVNKLYEQDNLTRVYEILERFNLLLEIFDNKKEQLYIDVRKIHESYKIQNPTSNWNISAKELLKLVDYDKEALFKAKNYYKGDTTSFPSTEKIDEQIRTLIANEYSNMKGIEKYGRYNGLCPYSPYEDIPKNSKTFNENAKKTGPISEKDLYSYRHPYHSLIYLYDSFVDDYNKFCELSKTPLLRTIHEPELFSVRYPDQKIKEHNAEMEKIRLENERIRNENKNAINTTGNNPIPTSQTTKIIHDTVYIERNNIDTLYLREGGDNSLSMAGYATNNLILLLDISGSMNEPGKLPLMKKSLERLLKIMRKEDELSIVIYSGDASIALPPTSCKDTEKIVKVIESLRSQGPTNGNAGIRLAYKVADENYVRGGNNRIILATDGEFPVNKDALKLIEKFAIQEIYLSVFFFGKNADSSEKLKDLASKGKGNYEHIKPENSDLKLLREAKAKKK